MDIHKGTRPNLEQKAAEIITYQLNEIGKQKSRVVFGVVGGRSVSGVFKKLAESFVYWENVHLFMVDERLVPLDNPQSNFSLVNAYLIDKLGDKLPRQNIHPFIFNPDIADEGVKEYENELLGRGGAFDVVLLSSGEDGHIGALYPNHPSVHNDSKYFFSMHDSPKPPSDRMTASRKLLLLTNTGILLFFGEGKKGAFHNFEKEDLSIEEFPANIVKEFPNAYIFSDAAHK